MTADDEPPSASPAARRELDRLVEEAEHLADVARRSPSFVVQHGVALALLALAPRAPGARLLFGELGTAWTAALLAPGYGLSCVSAVLLRRKGSRHVAYLACEIAESALLYGGSLALAFVTRLPVNVLYILLPFTAVFWANAKPFWARIYGVIVGASHAALVGAIVWRGGADAPRAAAFAALVGAGAATLLALLASRGRAALRLEAERNVLRRRLDAARLDDERARVAELLRAGVGAALGGVLASLTTADLERQARAALAELDGLVGPGSGGGTLVDLARDVDARCRALCVDAAYASTLEGDPAAVVGAAAAHAVARVAQELVRNAVTHGRATVVRVGLAQGASGLRLTVVDDGLGLDAAVLEGATGGLENARRWLAALGGELVVAAGAGPGATLTASVPAE